MKNNIKPLITHEIGSLAKPSWRVKAIAGTKLESHDIEDALNWGQRLKVENLEELLAILAKTEGFTHEEKERIIHYSSIFGIRFFESAGLDLVWDGEQQRVEMYEYPIQHIEGFHFHGHVRSFDNKYYRKASCEAIPQSLAPYHVEEFLNIQRCSSREVKIPVTGAYTLVDWSYDSHYLRSVAPGIENIRSQKHAVREKFMKDMAANVIYPNLVSLFENGAKYVQIDEPAATTKRDEIELFVQSLKESILDLAGKLFFSVHICFSDYSKLFPSINQLDGILDEIHLEYANRDSTELGLSETQRTGYGILSELKKTSFTIGLGVLDIHTDFIESPTLIRDRILYACDVIQDPYRIMVAPDCGLRTRTWEVTYQKLVHMVEGRNLALKELGL